MTKERNQIIQVVAMAFCYITSFLITVQVGAFFPYPIVLGNFIIVPEVIDMLKDARSRFEGIIIGSGLIALQSYILGGIIGSM